MTYRILLPGEKVAMADFPDDAIYFFDFDGCIAMQCEEKLFRLPEGAGERRRLEVIAERVGIDASLYNTQYLRHLVFQAATQYAIERYGPVFNLIAEVDDALTPYFVMTARSGLYAIKRMLAFLETSYLKPQEVFCLGRASKADLLETLLEEWPDREIIYLDDSVHHTHAARALGNPRLHIVEVRHDADLTNAEAMNVALHA